MCANFDLNKLRKTLISLVSISSEIIILLNNYIVRHSVMESAK